MFSTIRAAGQKVSSTIRTVAVATENIQVLHSSRIAISTCSALNVRKIEISEQSDNKTGKKNVSIEGVVHDLPKHNIVLPMFSKQKGCQNVSENCHPLCRVGFVHEIKHTDVLILVQFMDNEGKIIPRTITGLCRRQHTRMSKLIKMAAKAGLFPKDKDIFSAQKEKLPATRFNSYWDDSSIDIQHNERIRHETKRSFRT